VTSCIFGAALAYSNKLHCCFKFQNRFVVLLLSLVTATANVGSFGSQKLRRVSALVSVHNVTT